MVHSTPPYAIVPTYCLVAAQDALQEWILSGARASRYDAINMCDAREY